MYEKFNSLAKSLVSRLVGHADEAPMPDTVNRLQQLNNRCSRAPEEETDDKDGYIGSPRRHHDSPGNRSGEAVSHWCGDSGRYRHQEIRKGEELKGAQQCFEIDPIAKLPD